MRPVVVFIAGLLWALLVLVLHTWCERNLDFSLMGYYISLLPMGAGLVGTAAGIGFALAAHWLGFRVSGRQFLVFAVALVAVYWLERYVSYRHIHPIYDDTKNSVPFGAYTDYLVRSWAFTQKDGSPGEAWGLWGYSLLLAELLGYCLGGLMIPAIVSARPYCWHCEHYMKLRSLGLLPASIPRREVVVTDTAAMAAYDAEFEAAYHKGLTAVDTLKAQAQAAQSIDYRSTFAPLLIKDTSKLPAWVGLGLQRCPSCHNGRATAELNTRKGGRVDSQSLFQVDVPAAFVEKLESTL